MSTPLYRICDKCGSHVYMSLSCKCEKVNRPVVIEHTETIVEKVYRVMDAHKGKEAA